MKMIFPLELYQKHTFKTYIAISIDRETALVFVVYMEEGLLQMKISNWNTLAQECFQW